MEDTKIQWATHTFNPWRGCTKVSAGCTNCYADAQSKRNPATLGVWGDKGTRVVAAESAWKEPFKWQKAAALAADLFRAIGGDPARPGTIDYKGWPATYERPRVFCASLADVFEQWGGWMQDSAGRRLFIDDRDGPWRGDLDSPVTMDTVRARLFNTIRLTPHLDWLLVTKRIEHVASTIERLGLPWLTRLPPNVWLLASVEDQATADARIPQLLKIPAAVHGISMEPLLERVNLKPYLPNTFTGFPRGPHLGWVIVGGESGHNARPCNIEAIRSVVRQCREAGVPVFVKQLGAKIEARGAIDPIDQFPGLPHFRQGRDEFTALVTLNDAKGGDMAEWPKDLRVREFPTTRSIA